MPTDLNLTTLIINKMTLEQYDALETKSPGELYLVPDVIDNTITENGTNPVTGGSIYNALSGKADISSLASVATSGDYGDLSNKPTIPSAVTETTVTNWGFTKNTGTYSKPNGGIPKTDLASDVLTSLGKADTALQSFTETDPTVKLWAKNNLQFNGTLDTYDTSILNFDSSFTKSYGAGITTISVSDKVNKIIPGSELASIFGQPINTSGYYLLKNDNGYPLYWEMPKTTITSGSQGALYYPIAGTQSPTFSGTPSAPTATTGTNTTLLATTAFVLLEIGSTTYAGSTTPAGPATKAVSIPFGQVDSTSTSTAFTATVDGITELRDGVCCYLRNGYINSASGCTLDINNLGAKPMYITSNSSTRVTSLFSVGYTYLFVYNSSRIENGCWDLYLGAAVSYATSQYIGGNSKSTLPAALKFYKYKLLFTSADGSHYVPANTSTSTNATSTRTVNLTPINPFGTIVYYTATTAIEAEAVVGNSYAFILYGLTLGYSFNRTGAALTLTISTPVYIKCAPQADGSAIIDADNPYVLALPTTDDGKIYIYLGNAFSATQVLLVPNHPVYYYKDGAIRLWTGGGKEDIANKKTAITGNESSNTYYPTTKAVADYVSGIVGDINTILDEINGEEI